MANHPESARGAIVVGDGKFDVRAVGTSAYQGLIEGLVGGKTPMGYGVEPGQKRTTFAALLLPDLDDLYDKNAVRVIIRDITVGYLESDTAKAFVCALAQNGLDRAACRAAICGGSHRGLNDKPDDGLFRVRLDIIIPFQFRTPKI
jgi:HIRAN domain